MYCASSAYTFPVNFCTKHPSFRLFTPPGRENFRARMRINLSRSGSKWGWEGDAPAEVSAREQTTPRPNHSTWLWKWSGLCWSAQKLNLRSKSVGLWNRQSQGEPIFEWIFTSLKTIIKARCLVMRQVKADFWLDFLQIYPEWIRKWDQITQTKEVESKIDCNSILDKQPG